MSEVAFVNDARVMAKGQVTIPNTRRFQKIMKIGKKRNEMEQNGTKWNKTEQAPM